MTLSKNTWFSFLAIAILSAAVLIVFARPYRIHGDCMEPAFQDGKLYFLNKASRILSPHHIGDVILFNHENKVWISRIVALENNTIKINQDTVILNGTHIQDSVNRDWSSWQYGIYGIDTAYKVPPEHVYVLSDKLSAHHDDSRVFGAIPNSAIIGKLW